MADDTLTVEQARKALDFAIGEYAYHKTQAKGAGVNYAPVFNAIAAYATAVRAEFLPELEHLRDIIKSMNDDNFDDHSGQAPGNG